MEEFKSTKKGKQTRRYLMAILILLIILFILIWLYSMYKNIQVKEYMQDIDVKRTSQTVELAKEENKKVVEAIEEATLSVVGISKIKNIGTTIFLKNSSNLLGLGTGIIITENGYILTNAHVSGQKYSTCYVTLETGEVYTGNVLWSDIDVDLSIVKINAKNLRYAKLGNSDDIKVGESVYAIGNPIGFEFQRTVTSGIVSAKDRTIKIEENSEEAYVSNLIQTDTTINMGNSGGPLINMEGEVIGVNSLKITSAEGISFAIPINLVKTIIEKFKTEGKFEEASLGIFAYDRNVIPYLESKVDFNTGIYVVQVAKNSSAYMAGLREKDIILEIDGIGLEKMSDLRTYIYTKKIGDEVNLRILRNRTIVNIKMELIRK